MKKIKFWMVFVTFILSFLIHFAHVLYPSILTSIFAPVNESVWEHMKIIYTCILISSLIEYFIYKKKSISFNNFLISIPITSILSIIIYLILYIPLELLFGHSLFLAAFLLFIIYIIAQIISYYILNFKKIKYGNIIGIILIIVSYIIFTYLTYNPIKNDLFLDTQTNTYGLEK